MAKTKAEMAEDRERYHKLVANAQLALRENRFREAVKIASSSWKHIDGMMQFERKYENKEFSNIEAIDIVLEYAPLLFEFTVLDELEALLKAQRKIDRDASDDLAGNLSKARTRMLAAHQLWNHLEEHGDCQQNQLCSVLGGEQDQWRLIATTWEKMEVIHRALERGSLRLTLVTRMSAEVAAKCPSCGAVQKRTKSKLLDVADCSICSTRDRFVFLSQVLGTGK